MRDHVFRCKQGGAVRAIQFASSTTGSVDELAAELQ